MNLKASFIALLLAITSTGLQAQNKDLFLVFNEASWCKYCKAHGERIHALIDDYATNNNVLVIGNNVTDDETRKIAQPQFEKLGLQEYMQFKKGAAEVFVFNGRTSQIMDKFPIKLDSEKILERLNKAMTKVKSS